MSLLYKKACKTDEYLDIKNCPCKKRLFGKLLLACGDEILNTTETSLDDKKVTREKNNCLSHTISLVVVCLLVVVVIMSYYYYYTRHWMKKGIHLIEFNIK